MTFVQLIDCRTSRLDEMNRLLDSWVEQTKGKRTATHAMVAKDRSDASHLIEIVEFPSYEEAMRNSNLPETDRIFQEMVALCDEMPVFTDLDVVRDQQLNLLASQAFFASMGTMEPDRIGVHVTGDYVDHDPSYPEAMRGVDAVREQYAEWLASFDFRFRIDDQMAQDDRVCTRWTWAGRHKGDFMGIPATGQDVTMEGTTWQRFRDGRICEGWWSYDRAGLMEQLGVLGG
ncbi:MULTISPECIES: ester cyclase [unclassified Streptomyces]|uniref:ester cyclase n=1 Tax=unclassified Streptomyces TaxID=2593676 RepID=UPI001F04DAE7|nr:MULTISPECIES: ester cyclase [unclassified Streptomyces]MCH0563357.1 ester cyclase [Streptomyces sp. MUM 2J]MCH0572540.1 ester cyclase [Streptomyces sp. MUM 136J]